MTTIPDDLAAGDRVRITLDTVAVDVVHAHGRHTMAVLVDTPGGPAALTVPLDGHGVTIERLDDGPLPETTGPAA
jgi:hypothetical protein